MTLINDTKNIYKATPAMILLSLIIGFIVGLVIWLAFDISILLTEMIWSPLATFPWLPLIICPIGGLILGLIIKYTECELNEIEEIIEIINEKGTYKLKKPFVSIIMFILPIAFGGSIGPEAGLTGIIVAGAIKINEILKKAGLHVINISEITVSASLSAIFATPLVGMTYNEIPTSNEYEFKKAGKFILYTAASFGAFGAIILINNLLNVQTGIPRFEWINPQTINYWWFIPCLIIGYIGGFIYHFINKFTKEISNKMENYKILKPLIAGIILAIMGVTLPYTLFSGETQSFIIMSQWSSIAAIILLLTGLFKCGLTPMCINLGWKGGLFFPCIFAGITLGYAMALISGIDPIFCVTITTATLLSTIQRKPIFVIALLLLLFPFRNIIWLGLAAIIGSIIPIPKQLLKK